MKKIGLLSACMFIVLLSFAQQKAVTETGSEVILYDDGTWEYLNNDEDLDSEIPTNKKNFTKDKDASFLVKSNKLNVGFWINPKEWSFKKADNNEEAEYEFQLKGKDLYAMVISEQVEIPLKNLKQIAVENGKAAAPDLRIVKEEYRTVNGIKVLFLQMNGTLQGIKFTYYGYYFSNENGTIQFITYTSQNLLSTYMDDCEKILNGLVEVN